MAGAEVEGSTTAGIGVVSDEEVSETEWAELQSRIGVGGTDVGGNSCDCLDWGCI